MKNGPFLVITTYNQPYSHVNTSKWGWSDNPINIKCTEVPEVLSKVSDNKLREASTIIDLQHKKFVKSRNEKPSEELLNYYLQKYMGGQ